MSNHRLRTSVARAGLQAAQIGEELGVDHKTVERWLGGRTPHREHRQRLAQLLATDPSYLWPEIDTLRGPEGGQVELVALYPHRADVPQDLWRQSAAGAHDHIDVLAYAALFLPEQDAMFVETVRSRADEGCQVRLLLGDPASDVVNRRGEEEGLGEAMSARIHTTLLHYRPLLGHECVAVHLHATTLYNSIFRFDDELLVNAHIWGTAAYRSPVMHLRHVSGATLFERYASSFDAVWNTSVPYAVDASERRSSTS